MTENYEGREVLFPRILKRMMISYPNGVLNCYFAIEKLLEKLNDN